MQVDVVIEQRFYQCAQGKLWTENAFANAFWQRYLMVFSQVNIVARVQSVATPQPQWQRVDGDGVSWLALPFYLGPSQFLRNLPALVNVLRQRRKLARAVIYRVPGILSLLYQWFAMPMGKKYAAEVVGDPADVFAKGASHNPLRPFIKFAFVNMLRWQCRKAIASAYVTRYSLQTHYPPGKGRFSTHYSSIQLQDADFQQQDVNHYQWQGPLKLICIGNLAQPYKGCDFVLETLAKLKQQGVACQLTWLGGGALLPQMQTLADELGIAEQVHFVGNVSQRQDIRNALDQADVFLLGSRQEGLPRVLIEAMARSKVAVATNVGGVPELLPGERIIERDNHQQLIQQIRQLQAMSPAQRCELGAVNYQHALDYADQELVKRRRALYLSLLKASQ